MNHVFDVDHARQYGLPEAVLISNFQFWIAKNRANKENEREGRTWTYNSIKAFTDLFPYLSVGQIRRTLDRLVELKVLITGTFNERAVDRTKWYAFYDECIFLPRQNHLSDSSNASAESDKSLYRTDVNTDVNTDKQRAVRTASASPGIDTSSKATTKNKPATKFAPLAELLAVNVPSQVAEDWLTLRTAKRLPVTRTVLDELTEKAGRAGLTLEGVLRVCCSRGWGGFEVHWLAADKAQVKGAGRNPPTFEASMANAQRAKAKIFGTKP